MDLESLSQRLIGRTIMSIRDDDDMFVIALGMDDGATVVFEATTPPPWHEPEIHVRIVEPTSEGR
jgi:hypothetical protein